MTPAGCNCPSPSVPSVMQMGAEEAEGTYEFITTRQIGRRALVGSTDTNRPVIEDSYRRVLDILRRVFERAADITP